MEDETTEGTKFLSTAFDFPTERSGLLALNAEWIEAGRVALPVVCFYRGEERVLMVTSRSTDDKSDGMRAVKEILTLFPSLQRCESVLVSFVIDSMKLEDETESPAVLVILVKRNGAEAMAYPFHVDEDNGEVVYDMDAMPHSSVGRIYPDELAHAFAVHAFQYVSMGTTKEIIQWLFSKGHEAQFFGDWSIDNINAKGALGSLDALT